MNNINNLISKFSKKLGLDLNYFLKNGFWISLFQITNLISSFILSIIFANFVSQEYFGKYNLVTSILSFIMIFSIQELGATIIRGCSQNKDNTYNIAIKIILRYSIIGTIFLILISSYYFLKSNLEFGWIFLFLSILFPAYSISSHFQNYYSGKKKFKEYSIFNSISTIISVSLTIPLVIFTDSLFLAIIIPITVKLLFNLYLTLVVVKSKIKNNKIDHAGIQNSKKTYLTHLMFVGSSRLEPILIGIFLGITELAIYTIITLIPNQGKTLFNFITPTFLPKLSENIENITKNNIFKHLFKLEIIFLLIFIIYVFIVNFIFSMLYNPYLEYSTLSLIYSLTLLTIPQIIIYIYFKAKLNTKFTNIINLFTIITSILIIYTTIIFSSFENVIYSKVIHSILTFILTIILLSKSK